MQWWAFSALPQQSEYAGVRIDRLGEYARNKKKELEEFKNTVGKQAYESHVIKFDSIDAYNRWKQEKQSELASKGHPATAMSERTLSLAEFKQAVEDDIKRSRS